jgi:3',5'-cyclic AMP phosphodiesterase CpdA
MITVLDQFDPAKHYFKDPYPHVIIEDCLPQDLYNKLYNSFPIKEIQNTLPLLVGHTYRYFSNDVLNKKTIPVSSVWEDFFLAHTSQDYYEKVLDIFKDNLKNIEWFKNQKVSIRNSSSVDQVVTETQFVVHNPVKETTRTDHLDNPMEIYAGLFYMRNPADQAEGGDFVIYETDKIEEVAKHNGRELLNTTARKTVKTIKYGANKFVMFLNSNRSAHGVTPRINSQTERLSINIIAEVTEKKLALFPLKKVG